MRRLGAVAVTCGQFQRSRPDLAEAGRGGDQLFSFGLQRCLLTRTAGHGDPAPQHTIWHEPGT